MVLICIQRSSHVLEQKWKILNLRIRYALIIFEILDTTALSQVNIMQSTMASILRANTQS